MTPDLVEKIELAYQRIRPYLEPTPLVRDVQTGLYMKCENLQKTGSFKYRGALAKLSLLPEGSRIVTASTGNHGLGVSMAANYFNHQVIVFLPKSASSQKREKLERQGVELVLVDGDSLQAELQGKNFAIENGFIWVSPYNDVDVISGQGTIGVELLQQLDQIDRIYITVGGGGLLSGIATWIHAKSPSTQIIACQPINSPEMYLSLQAGKVVMAPEELPTLSDGSAGPLEEDSITFPLCQQFIDPLRFALVSEKDIHEAIQYIHAKHGMMIEGAAGVAFAARKQDLPRKRDDRSVVILCGGNINPKVHEEICTNSAL